MNTPIDFAVFSESYGTKQILHVTFVHRIAKSSLRVVTFAFQIWIVKLFYPLFDTITKSST